MRALTDEQQVAITRRYNFLRSRGMADLKQVEVQTIDSVIMRWATLGNMPNFCDFASSAALLQQCVFATLAEDEPCAPTP